MTERCAKLPDGSDGTSVQSYCTLGVGSYFSFLALFCWLLCLYFTIRLLKKALQQYEEQKRRIRTINNRAFEDDDDEEEEDDDDEKDDAYDYAEDIKDVEDGYDDDSVDSSSDSDAETVDKDRPVGHITIVRTFTNAEKRGKRISKEKNARRILGRFRR